MTNLTSKAQLALLQLSRAHEREVMAKAKIRQEIEAAFQLQLQQIRMEKSLAANEALREGAPKTAIGRAIGTTAWKTIANLLSLTANQYRIEDSTWRVLSMEDHTILVDSITHEDQTIQGPLTLHYYYSPGDKTWVTVDYLTGTDPNPIRDYIYQKAVAERDRSLAAVYGEWDAAAQEFTE